MKLRSIRVFAGATLLALIVAGLAVSPASAEKKGGGSSENLCSATGATMYPPSDLDWEFFPPGEVVQMKDPSGRIRVMECQRDGTWKQHRLVNPAGGGVVITPKPAANVPADGGDRGPIIRPKPARNVNQP